MMHAAAKSVEAEGADFGVGVRQCLRNKGIGNAGKVGTPGVSGAHVLEFRERPLGAKKLVGVVCCGGSTGDHLRDHCIAPPCFDGGQASGLCEERVGFVGERDQAREFRISDRPGAALQRIGPCLEGDGGLMLPDEAIPCALRRLQCRVRHG